MPQGGATIVSWNSWSKDLVLESSTGLNGWQPVEGVVFGNFYLVPPGPTGPRYCRLQRVP